MTLPIPLNHGLEALGNSLHLIFAWLLVATIAIHILAALYHHIILKDHTIKRMIGFKGIG